MANANIKINAVAGSNTNLPLNTQVNLTTSDTGTTYLWSILSKPSGSSAVLNVTDQQSVHFTPDCEGSYLIRLVVNQGQVSEKTGQVVAGIRELETYNRIPAIGETTEASATDGWASEAVDEILRRVTRLEDSGVDVGEASVALSPGDTVYASGTHVLCSGLPGERTLVAFDKALGNDDATLRGSVGVVIEKVGTSAGSASLGDLVRVRFGGLFQGIPYSGSTPSLGDIAYVSDTGTLSTTQGTYSRQVGTLCAVDTGASTFDVWVGIGSNGQPILPAHEVVVGTGTLNYASIPAGTDGQLLLGQTGADPSFETLSGDATVDAAGAVTLKSVGTSGTKGSATQIPVFVTDAQGRVTSSTNTAINLSGLDWSAITAPAGIALAAGAGTNASFVGGSGSTAGTMSIGGGSSSAGVGANTYIFGGQGTTGGGNVIVSGGAATDPGTTGGSANFDAGQGTSSNGDVYIGGVTAINVVIGRLSHLTYIVGTSAYTPTTLVPTTGSTITPTATTHILTPASSVTGVKVAQGVDGQRLTLIGGNGNSTSFSKGTANYLALGSATRVLSQYHVLELVYSSTLGVWCEVAFGANSV